VSDRKGADDNGHMTEEPRAWKARTRGSEAEVDGAICPSTVTIRPMKISSRALPMSSGAVAEGDENNASL